MFLKDAASAKANKGRGGFQQFMESQLKGAPLAAGGAAATATPMVGKAVGAVKNLFNRGSKAGRVMGPIAGGVKEGGEGVVNLASKGAKGTMSAGERLKAAMASAAEHPYKTGAGLYLGYKGLQMGGAALDEASEAVRARTTGAWDAEAQGSLANKQMEIELANEQKRQQAVMPQAEAALNAKQATDITGRMMNEYMDSRQQINSMYAPSQAQDLLQMANMLVPPPPDAQMPTGE